MARLLFGPGLQKVAPARRWIGNMGPSEAPPAPVELEHMISVLSRLRSARPPVRAEVERAMDLGIGRLLALEGRLRSSSSSVCHRDGRSSSSDAAVEIATLRSLVIELRNAAMIERSFCAGFGFVLPRQSDGYPAAQ
jgi:hypothetical protein